MLLCAGFSSVLRRPPTAACGGTSPTVEEVCASNLRITPVARLIE